MKKRIFISLICMILISQSFATYAYELGPKYASNSTTFVMHSSLPSGARTASRVANVTWNNAGNFTLTVPTYISYGTFDFYDSRQEIAYLNFSLMGLPASALGGCATHTSGSTIVKADVILNSGMPWGSGYSYNYYDYQGVLTHEFGHLIGLNDTYSVSSATMYYSVSKNTSYGLRSLDTDDINGYNIQW